MNPDGHFLRVRDVSSHNRRMVSPIPIIPEGDNLKIAIPRWKIGY
jgi:hypothetical protein